MIRFGIKALGMMLFLAGMAGTVLAAPPPPGVPEIDAGSMASAIALVAGGVAMLTDRFRRKK